MITIASGIFGIGLISFSLSHTLWLSFFLLMLTGFGMMVHMASSNTILQTIVDDDKRGRVMSLYTTAFMGMAPLGSLAGGSLAKTGMRVVFAVPTKLIHPMKRRIDRMGRKPKA